MRIAATICEKRMGSEKLQRAIMPVALIFQMRPASLESAALQDMQQDLESPVSVTSSGCGCQTSRKLLKNLRRLYLLYLLFFPPYECTVFLQSTEIAFQNIIFRVLLRTHGYIIFFFNVRALSLTIFRRSTSLIMHKRKLRKRY